MKFLPKSMILYRMMIEITELNDKLYFTCKSNCAECYQKCEDCEYYSISYKDFQKVINELKEKNNNIR